MSIRSINWKKKSRTNPSAYIALINRVLERANFMIFQKEVTAFSVFQSRGQTPKYMRQSGNLYSSGNVFVQVCFRCVHRQQWNCHNTVSSKIIKKKFLSVSLHCFKCKSVKLLSVVVLRIEQFDYTFARFVWITCQYDIFFLCWTKFSKGNFRSMWVRGAWHKELQHCIVT